MTPGNNTTITDPTRHIDGNVDVSGTIACDTCHGGAGQSAPPKDTSNGTATTLRGVGAHRSHLGTSTWHAEVTCATCHRVPTTVGAVGHRDTALPAELTFTGRAVGTAWNGSTCTNSYCHGATLAAGGSATAPLWTRVNGTQATCTSCHGASVILNIVHAPASFLSRILAAIPPLALFLSFELLMGQIKGLVQRSGAVQSLEELFNTIRQKQAEFDELIRSRRAELETTSEQHQAEVQKLVGQLDQLKASKETLQAELQVLRQQQRTISQTAEALATDSTARARQGREQAKEEAIVRLLAFLSAHPYASLAEMGEAIGRSKSTANDYVSELQTNGQLHKNGHGWEVLSR